MKATQKLHSIGQSIWLDNITRGILNDGTLSRHIDELSVTGLTSNPTIFDHAIANNESYDDAIRKKSAEGKSGEPLFFELAIEDLRRAADLFRPIHDATRGVDGWVSLEVSPLLANDTASTIKAAAELHAQADRPDLFIRIPALAAPDTVNTMPEKTLEAFADHGKVNGVLPEDGGDAEEALAKFRRAGVDVDALADQLQREGAESFDKSWNDLLGQLAAKRAKLGTNEPSAAGKS